MTRRFAFITTLIVSLLAVSPLAAQLTLPVEQPIRMGRSPAVSPDGRQICFTYQGNLWVAPVTSGPATRLTANDSYDSNPRWSPDGKWIAFNSDREGGNQIFLIPAVGGPARQVTFHSVATIVRDWFPDGSSLLVTSSRDTRRESIYRLEVVSGRWKRLISDETNCYYPALSPDGKWIAYARGALVDIIRKGYRGAANFEIYVAPVDGATPPRRLTEDERNDLWPMWSADGKTVYFTSEREGLATIWKQPRDGGKATRVVEKPADAIRYPTLSRDGQTFAFECDNRICTASTRGGPAQEVQILCRTDERGSRTTFATYSGRNVSEYALSADGKRVAFVVRGDIFTVPIEKGGEAKRLTDNPTRDQDLAWAPDGKSLVYASNRDGRFHLYRVDLATRETKPLTKGTGIDTDPAFSPDGQWIAFRRGPQTGLYLIKPDGTGEQVVVKGPKVSEHRWSPDSRWLTYVQEDPIRNDDVWLVSVTPDGAGAKVGDPINASDYPAYNNGPRWFADGKKLAFRSNRTRNRDIETINHQGRYALYTVSLEKEKEKFEDEEEEPKPAESKPAEPKPAEKPAETKPGEKPAEPKPAEKKESLKVEVQVDPREIERRAKQLVSFDEGVGNFAVSPDGKTIVFTATSQGKSDIWQVSADGGSLQRLTTSGEPAGDFQWAPDSARFYYHGRGEGSIRWLPRGGGNGGSVGFTARMEIDRGVDYRAAFDEAWQVFNDRYYDRQFHGVDWKAVGDKYRTLVDQVTTRRDFQYLVTQMFGELNSSHTGISGGGGDPARTARATGYLGISRDDDYVGPGVKITAVLPRSPADREESRLQPGEYLLSVDGQDVQADASIDKALAEKVGRTVTLLVNSKPEKAGARTVKIKPINRGAFSGLLYEQWIDERRAMVDKASGGRLGYLHVADMGDDTRNRFERELFSIGQRKEGMIVDIRDNNGGDTHDSLLKILARNRHYFTFAPSTETPFPQPERAFVKPVILLINAGSLSDAEVFTNGFRELGLGKVVGTPTMGWIIFTSGAQLIDGSVIRIPFMGCYTLDKRDMENWGVPPDIRVENTPADFLAGRDPQLERAVGELLKEGKGKG